MDSERRPSHLNRTLIVGGLTREQLRESLKVAGVQLNPYAETLLNDAVSGEEETITVTDRSVREIGLPDGATLPQIFDRAWALGLTPCPPLTAAYLRLELGGQETAPDSVMSSGRAPTGSLTVATDRPSDDEEYPRGLYLRVIDGTPWLRGYQCDDEHVWSPADRFVFRAG